MMHWLTSTNHKSIGILYILTTFFFFIVAGILSLLIRLQLAHPDNTVLTPHAYNEVFTLHGTAMIFLVVAPFAFGLANYLVPLQIGAPDMAFPRLNLLSVMLFIISGFTIFAGVFAQGGAAAAGWTGYAPLSEWQIGTGAGQDLWIIGLILNAMATIMVAINFVTTILLYRAPGMTMWRMPIFTWEILATALLILMAFPSLTAVLFELLLSRHYCAHFFDPQYGGDPILYQHLFWFFGHPEVYVMILPYFGVITEVVSVFSGKPVFGYVGLVLSAFAIAGLSMGVWAHHMFTTGVVANGFFSGMSFLIAVPTGVKFWNWIGTMWRGNIRLTTSMLFAVGFLLNFLVGGVTGVMVASPPIDYHAEDTYFIVSHFHYTLGGGSLFAIFAAVYFWFPKMFGTRLNETLGKLNFWLMFVGFNLTFFPMYFMGIEGMPRRVFTYPAIADLPWLNLLASAGAGIMALAAIVFVVNVIVSKLAQEPAADDPWDAFTLEWGTSSPPPEFNFHALPPIRSERPVWDLHHPELAQQR
ncbi:MAG TPA: cbb3-type cytochrome c oxidase subunit I [Candidatus Baltobacteraceae bacterium]|jgi:cytochrome c oxidase subunit 1|nr:cbb3-type cytochrome c oxidase subunit I [Candidatus Baltobacteraceae bacterium]